MVARMWSLRWGYHVVLSTWMRCFKIHLYTTWYPRGIYHRVTTWYAHWVRNGLRRYFKDNRKIDIINDDFFEEANLCFSNILKKIRTTNKGQVRHYPEIEPEDLLEL